MFIIAPAIFGGSPVAECPLIDGEFPKGAPEEATEGSSSRRVRFNSVSSLSWSLVKPLPMWKNWSKRQTKASSFTLRPATTDRKLYGNFLASLDFKSLSISKTIEMGVGSAPK